MSRGEAEAKPVHDETESGDEVESWTWPRLRPRPGPDQARTRPGQDQTRPETGQTETRTRPETGQTEVRDRPDRGQTCRGLAVP